MSYKRKGGSGKTGTLRQQFNYYKRQLKNRLIQEQAFKEARGAGTIEARIQTMFKNRTFDEVFNEGITRKRRYKTIRLTGYEAVATEILSMQRRASKTFQAEQFKDNYLEAMLRADFSLEAIDEVEEALNNTSSDKLTTLIDSGVLPSIEYVYANTMNEDEAVNRIVNALEKGISSSEVRAIRQRAKELTPLIKAKNKIMGW